MGIVMDVPDWGFGAPVSLCFFFFSYFIHPISPIAVKSHSCQQEKLAPVICFFAYDFIIINRKSQGRTSQRNHKHKRLQILDDTNPPTTSTLERRIDMTPGTPLTQMDNLPKPHMMTGK
jgi:hypothetical protein